MSEGVALSPIVIQVMKVVLHEGRTARADENGLLHLQQRQWAWPKGNGHGRTMGCAARYI
jgi:hypothetical protein